MALRVGVVTGAQIEEIGGGWTLATALANAIKNTRSSHQFVFIDEFLRSHDDQKQANGLPTYLPTTLPERLEKAIARKQLDLIWYMIQNAFPVSVPFIATVWDLEHRKQPYFPEVSVRGWTWTEREIILQRSFTPRGFHTYRNGAGQKGDRGLLLCEPCSDRSDPASDTAIGFADRSRDCEGHAKAWHNQRISPLSGTVLAA